jgi:hypothetical protein
VRPWLPARDYIVGDKRLWEGVVLVCCIDHSALPDHVHPWAAGAIFAFKKAAALWAPAGEPEASKLREIAKFRKGDLRDLALAAAGPQRLGGEAGLAA